MVLYLFCWLFFRPAGAKKQPTKDENPRYAYVLMKITEEHSMSFMMIFALGYAVGGVSALLVIGLARAGRSDSAERGPIEVVGRDVEHYSL